MAVSSFESDIDGFFFLDPVLKVLQNELASSRNPQQMNCQLLQRDNSILSIPSAISPSPRSVLEVARKAG